MKCQGERGPRCGTAINESTARRDPQPIDEVEPAAMAGKLRREFRKVPAPRLKGGSKSNETVRNAKRALGLPGTSAAKVESTCVHNMWSTSDDALRGGSHHDRDRYAPLTSAKLKVRDAWSVGPWPNNDESAARIGKIESTAEAEICGVTLPKGQREYPDKTEGPLPMPHTFREGVSSPASPSPPPGIGSDHPADRHAEPTIFGAGASAPHPHLARAIAEHLSAAQPGSARESERSAIPTTIVIDPRASADEALVKLEGAACYALAMARAARGELSVAPSEISSFNSEIYSVYGWCARCAIHGW
jgi:hypothetical protein